MARSLKNRIVREKPGHIRKSQLTRKRKRKGADLGGSVIAAGSFGCVFRPSLRCKEGVSGRKPTESSNSSLSHSSNTESSNLYVSKLGKKQVIESEYKMMTNLKNILDTIPNYDTYFGLNVSEPCEPSRLDKEDLSSFDDKCKMKDISSETVNNSNVLPSLSIINLPYGGISLLGWKGDGNLRYEEAFDSFLSSSSNLIEHGIVPMNKKGVLHNDIHSRNILVKEGENDKFISNLTLIDWGLATTNTSKTIHKIVSQRDYPISRIFFSVTKKNDFIHYLARKMRNHGIIKYSFDNATKTMREKVDQVMLGASLELVVSGLDKDDQEKSLVRGCGKCDILFEDIIRNNETYTTVYIPLLKEFLNNKNRMYEERSRLYDIGRTFSCFINTMQLAGMLTRYAEVNDYSIRVKFREYFFSTYRFNADVYAMCNCILSGAIKRHEYSNLLRNDSFTILARVLLEEVYLKPVDVIDFVTLCEGIDKAAGYKN